MGRTASLVKPKSRQRERGNVLTYTVLSFLFLFLAVGLGVDLSHLYSVRAELQNAADAAALAGASALLLPEETKIKTATDRAVETLNKNKYNFYKEFADVTPPADQRALVKFAVNLDGPYMSEEKAADTANIRFVMVETPTVPVSIFFSIPILGLQRTMKTTATAGLSSNSNVWCNFVPIAVIEGPFGGGIGWLDTNGDKALTDDDCKPPADAPAELTPPTCDPKIKFCAGCKYKMVAGPGAWQDTSPGNYQALDTGSGASDLKFAIAGGSTNCLTSNDNAEFFTESETGRMTGPITKGLNTRFDIYKESDCPPGITCSNFGGDKVKINGETKDVEAAFPPDRNVYAGVGPPPPDTGKGKGGGPPVTGYVYSGIWNFEYKGATEKPPVNFEAPSHTASEQPRREIFLPIISSDQFGPGKTTVKFTTFGKFFLNKFVDEGNKEIYVEYMGIALGAGGYDPDGGTTTAPVVVPVLYR